MKKAPFKLKCKALDLKILVFKAKSGVKLSRLKEDDCEYKFLKLS
jgi:hypothetical protein